MLLHVAIRAMVAERRSLLAASTIQTYESTAKSVHKTSPKLDTKTLTWGAMLDNLHVLPAAQGRGIGKQLLHRASVWVRDHFPGQGMFLWVFEANVHARDFYERLGATVVERTVVEPPGGGSLAEWRYAWPNIDDLCSATEV